MCVGWDKLTSSLRLLASSTAPAAECPDRATRPAAAAAAAAALRGLIDPREREKKQPGKKVRPRRVKMSNVHFQ